MHNKLYLPLKPNIRKYFFLLPLALILVTVSCTKEDQEALQKTNKNTNPMGAPPFITCIKCPKF